MNARYRQRSVAHGETDALRGTRADVAGRENPGDGGFQRARVAVLEGPATGAQGVPIQYPAPTSSPAPATPKDDTEGADPAVLAAIAQLQAARPRAVPPAVGLRLNALPLPGTS